MKSTIHLKISLALPMNDEKRQLKTELFRNPANDVVISPNLSCPFALGSLHGSSKVLFVELSTALFRMFYNIKDFCTFCAVCQSLKVNCLRKVNLHTRIGRMKSRFDNKKTTLDF